MDPTRKKHPKPKSSSSSTTTTHSHNKPLPTTQGPIPSSTLNKITALYYSRWNANHKAHPPSKPADPPPRVDIHLQAKALTLSANADSFDGSLLKNNHPLHQHDQKPRHHHHHHQQQQQQQRQRQRQQNDNLSTEMEKKQIKEAKEKNKVTSKEKDDPRRPSISLTTGRRRSFCDSKIEMSDFLSGVGAKVVAMDMPPFMQIHAVSYARKVYDSLEKFTSKTLACTLKKEFDGVYGPAWHCIVGTSFGSFVTHSVGGFLYFSMDHKLYILLFKTTVQRAD
uniref:Uncharacterized protein n=1 Tax=Nelumbo nucifera TaxID=4432 RepID=A0A822YI09_NELNU|nr:TPA_asm: hypothetical protein HUJ06_009962 [Nelumbo nucifera]